MAETKQWIRELATHALTKLGSQQSDSMRLFDPFVEPEIVVPGPPWKSFWGGFLKISPLISKDIPLVTMPVVASRLKEHHAKYPAIRATEGYLERDGHIQLEFQLDGSVPVEYIKLLIDEAYQIVWAKVPPDRRKKFERAARNFDETDLLQTLIQENQLEPQRVQIEGLIKPAILLRTKKGAEAKIPLGATKLGGRPDLPDEIPWPAFSRRPLAFLAQIDLATMRVQGTPLPGLPNEGLLSLFSAWGWSSEDAGDPAIPESGLRDQEGWTTVLRTPVDNPLRRRQKPSGLKHYTAAAVEPIAVMSLPNHEHEPNVQRLRWSPEVVRRFDEMQTEFRSAQMEHYLKTSDALTAPHQLGGYALFQQIYPPELDSSRCMLLQIGSDALTKMMWGDGGELTFYADSTAIKQGRFERIWGTCQGG
jgi:uncharacterized protein YwqG